MKGRINLASSTRKGRAKGCLSRARVGARSIRGKEGEERREGGESTARKGTRENNTTGTRRHKQHRRKGYSGGGILRSSGAVRILFRGWGR